MNTSEVTHSRQGTTVRVRKLPVLPLLASFAVLAFLTPVRELAQTQAQSQSQTTMQGQVVFQHGPGPVNVFANGAMPDCNTLQRGMEGGGAAANDCLILKRYIADNGNPTGSGVNSDCVQVQKQIVMNDLQRQNAQWKAVTDPKAIAEINNLNTELYGLRSQYDDLCGEKGGSPGFPTLSRTRPRPQPVPPYTRPDGSFGPSLGGMPPAKNPDGSVPQSQPVQPKPGVPYPCKACSPQSCRVDGGLISCVNPSGLPQPSGDEGRFVQGFLLGAGQCVWSGCSDPKQLAIIALAAFARKWQQVQRYAGLANIVMRGTSAASIVNYMQYGGDRITSTDPYDMGLVEGKNFCLGMAAWVGVTAPQSLATGTAGAASMPLPGGLLTIVEQAEQSAVSRSCPASPLPNFRDLMRVTSWLKSINPVCGCANCGNCAIAVVNALRGRGVLPAPQVCIQTTYNSTLENIFNQKFTSFADLRQLNNAVYSRGDGAIGIVWIGETSRGGHYVVVANDAGSVRWLDGQLGKEFTLSEMQGLLNMNGWHGISLLPIN